MLYQKYKPRPWPTILRKPFLSQFFFFFLRFIYLFTETERETHRQREKQASCREPDVELDRGSPGSRPGLKAALNCWATRAVLSLSFNGFFSSLNSPLSLGDSLVLPLLLLCPVLPSFTSSRSTSHLFRSHQICYFLSKVLDKVIWNESLLCCYCWRLCLYWEYIISCYNFLYMGTCLCILKCVLVCVCPYRHSLSSYLFFFIEV